MKTFIITLVTALLVTSNASAGLVPVGVPDVQFRVGKKNAAESGHGRLAQSKAPGLKRKHQSGVRIASR